MNRSSRKEFLKNSAILLAATLAGSSFDTRKYRPLLSFSTLGCPDWTFPQIISFAAKNGYKGIEIRGILREMDLTKSEIFQKNQIQSTLALMKDHGLRFVGLGSSAKLQFAQGAERVKNLDEAKRFIDLAAQIKCPYIRVFPDKFSKENGKESTIALIIEGLISLSEYARNTSVGILIETHGDLVWSEDIKRVMQLVNQNNVGIIWDFSNMWTVTKESPIDMFQQLQPYIRHTHIKDAKIGTDKLHYTLLGKGDVPIFDAVDLLAKNQYKGFYSFEWEKLWHPEIEEPELALADYPIVMKRRFK